MTTSTFDASSGSGGAVPGTDTPEPTGGPFDSTDTLLDQLRARVEDRDEDDAEPWVKEVPKIGIRLVCDPDIDATDYRRWLKSAQPRTKGRRRASSALDLDQFALCVRALTATCIRLEMRRGRDDWSPMTAPGKSEPLTLESSELLRTFGVMDAGSLLRKLFGRDARVIDAGQELLAEAGYLDGEDDDDENPE